MYLCDEAVSDASVKDIDAAYAYCSQRKRNGSAAISRLLDTLEPGGKGSVQVGYTATLQLLSIYQKTPKGWAIDKAKELIQFLDVIAEVKRPVVVYFSADHFDSVSPLADALRKDPVNLMQLRDGKPLELNYFGYRIIPYTLSTDAAIPVNQYRFEALDYLAKRIRRCPRPCKAALWLTPWQGVASHVSQF